MKTVTILYSVAIGKFNIKYISNDANFVRVMMLLVLCNKIAIFLRDVN